MATLESPGVQVTVIDESFYTPAAPGSVPMIFVASSEDKTNPSGSIAQGTTAANAGKVYLITSQRDLTDTFGTPQFYTDVSGNPLHGNELNEYGLQAAYSLLGVSSRAYVVRANLDLGELNATSDQPNGDPVGGTHWVDTASSKFGVKVWNSSTLKFTDVTPIVLDDDSPASSYSSTAKTNPSSGIGQNGDYCIVVNKNNSNSLYYKSSGAWSGISNTPPGWLTIAPHYQYPNYNASTATNSLWINTTEANSGAKWSVKRWDSVTKTWSVLDAPIYPTQHAATYNLDPTGGGANIAAGSIFIENNPEENGIETATFKIYRRVGGAPTAIVSSSTTANSSLANYSFTIKEGLTTSTGFGATITVSISTGSAGTALGSLVPAAISAASGLTNIVAEWNTSTNKLTIKHTKGGDFYLEDGNNSPLNLLKFGAYNPTNNAGTANLYTAPAPTGFDFLATNWKPLVYEAKSTAPYTEAADGTLWYSSVVDEVDIMIHDGTKWVGYKTATSPVYSNGTDPMGPIVSASEPTTQQDGTTALVTGDIWVSTDDLEQYGNKVYVYDSTITVGSKWVLQDTTDQSTPSGWLFADARWATTGTNPDQSTIAALLESNYVDPDAPDPALYPKGMRLWNTRRSGFNVKKYVVGHIDISANDGKNQRFPHGAGESMASYEPNRWVSQYNVAADGSGVFGRHAQRAQVVNALKEMIDSNDEIRDTDTLNFNLMAAPGYPEAIQNMVAFNNDRGQTAFVVGDTPFRLLPTGTALNAWGLNKNLALDNNDDGAVSYDEYMAMYYPSGYTNDNTGNFIVVPPSHMMLRTILRSDAVSYPWFAPAGTRRGGVDNATSVGYLDSEGEFRTVALHQSLRDVLDDVKINPIATLTGVGIVAYGQRTRAKNASALDRINVSRLVVYLRRQLDIMARPFLFEPNDAQTRREIKAAAESILLELVGQRGLYDFIVVCDETNNTPSRIDRNELYVDIAVEPVKAVEFIYIPLRLKNTGDIAAGL